MTKKSNQQKLDPRINSIPYDIQNGDNEKVKQLLSEIGIDACDDYSRTALIWASFYNNLALLTWLIDKGAKINHQDSNGYSGLHFAGQEKSYDCAKFLIDAGANLELTDQHGNTPLWTTIFNSKGDTRLVRLYVQRGANLEHINKREKTPKQLAETIAGFDLTAIKK